MYLNRQIKLVIHKGKQDSICLLQNFLYLLCIYSSTYEGSKALEHMCFRHRQLRFVNKLNNADVKYFLVSNNDVLLGLNQVMRKVLYPFISVKILSYSSTILVVITNILALRSDLLFVKYKRYSCYKSSSSSLHQFNKDIDLTQRYTSAFNTSEEILLFIQFYLERRYSCYVVTYLIIKKINLQNEYCTTYP